MNTPQVGDRVVYHGESNTVVSGYLAERGISPLTQNAIYRVVDSMSEAKDKEAGKWVSVMHVISIR